MSKEETKKEMIEKELAIKNINEIMQEFVKQEQGNRITAFNMSGLLNILLVSLDKKKEN